MAATVRARRPGLPDFDTAAAWLGTHPRVRRARELADGVGAPHILLAIAMGLVFGVFLIHMLWRHNRFATFDHDLGIWDQNIWLLAHGKSFNTVRGLEVFGFHVSPALYLFVPFYWLGAGPNFLDTVMALALACGAIPVFRAARHHLGSEWQALLPAFAFLINFSGQWVLQETFHPEVVAITPLLFAYLASLERRWRAFALWSLLAVAFKEDVALAIFMLGFILVVRHERRVGLTTMAAAALWFVLATQVVIPAFSDAGNFTENLYGDLGDSPTQILRTSVEHPSIPIDHLRTADASGYVFDLAASYGFTPFLSPLPLLIGLPQALVNLLAIHDFFWTPRFHYVALPLAAMTIAMVEGVARPRRRSFRALALAALAVGALYTATAWGVSPMSHYYREGYWPLEPNPSTSVLNRAIDIPASRDSVSAAYNVVPHLTHREHAYTFPNPWVQQNWGVHNEHPADPDTVDWIIIEPSYLNATDRETLDDILASGSWDVVLDNSNVLVAHHRRGTDAGS